MPPTNPRSSIRADALVRQTYAGQFGAGLPEEVIRLPGKKSQRNLDQ
jgi:hypothetical protein